MVATQDVLKVSVALGVAAVAVYFALFGRSPKIELGAYEALGAVTAEETAQLVGGRGQVLVIARDTGPDKIPSVESQMATFERTLRAHGGLTQVTRRFQATAMTMMATGGGVPPDHLASALQAHPDAAALVLFCGLPPLPDAEMGALRKRGVKIVVVSSFRPDYADLLERQVIHLVITPRPEGPPPDAKPPRTLRERFDQEYAILTAAAVAGGR